MPHPTFRSQTAWKFLQLGLLVFPLIPILGALGLFLALVITWRQEYHKIIRRRLNWVLAILGIWLAIAAIFAFDRVAAFLGVFNFLPFFVFFAALSTLIQTTAQLRQIAKFLVITSVPVVILGLGQLFLNWSSPVQLQSVLGWLILPGGNPPGRMASVFMYTNILAGYLVIVFILGLGLWLESYQQVIAQREKALDEDISRKLVIYAPFRGTKAHFYYFIFLSVGVIADLVALILTNSRNAWAIAIFASLAFAVYQGWRWLVAGVAAIASGILGAAFSPPPFQQWLRVIVPAFFWARLTDALYPDRPSALLRTTQWQFALSLTQQRPWTGWGLRNFTPLYQAQMQVWLGHPHSFLLMLTAEAGILFSLLFCGWVSWILIQASRLLLQQHLNQDRLLLFSYLIAFFACILFNTVDVTIFDLRLNTLGWLLLSAISGVVYSQRSLLRRSL